MTSCVLLFSWGILFLPFSSFVACMLLFSSSFSNAFKFTPAGGSIQVRATFTPTSPSDMGSGGFNFLMPSGPAPPPPILEHDDSPDVSPRPGGSGKYARIYPGGSSSSLRSNSGGGGSSQGEHRKGHGKIRIEFMDTGHGMSEEDKGKLFDSVMQFNPNVLQSGGGSGLGLFISNAIMKKHAGGAIGVLPGGVAASGGGEDVVLSHCDTATTGIVFYIELDGYVVSDEVRPWMPIRENSNNEIVTVNENSCDKSSVKGSSRVHTLLFSKVLVVEDSKLNRKMMGKILSAYSEEIVMAEDGAEGVTAVKHCMEQGEPPFDVIFMDSLMPNMNGIDATKVILKELKFPNPIVAVTGNMVPDDVRAFKAAGALAVLGKPLELDKLNEVLNGASCQ